MTFANAPVFIDPPAPPPRPPGIFDVAMGPMPLPRADAGDFGVMYIPDTCPSGTQLYAINCPSVSGSKVFNALDTPVSGAPFAVITSFTCSSIGMAPTEMVERVRTRLSLREQMAVEQRIWQGSTGTGALGQLPGLFRGATSLGTAGCVTEAVEMLEQQLATSQVVGGMLHMRPGMNAHMANSVLLKQGAGRAVTTWLGTPINFGYGYDGTGPAGEATTTDDEYVYASGRVAIWQDTDIFVPPWQQTLNTSTNTITLLAERSYVVAIECGVWTVKVTRNCTTAN